MGNFLPPAGPVCRTDDRAKHPAFRLRILNAVRIWEIQPVQFRRERQVGRPVDHGDLSGTNFAPLRDQLSNDGGVTPRQQQLGPAHPHRRARRQDDDAKVLVDLRHAGLWGKFSRSRKGICQSEIR